MTEVRVVDRATPIEPGTPAPDFELRSTPSSPALERAAEIGEED